MNELEYFEDDLGDSLVALSKLGFETEITNCDLAENPLDFLENVRLIQFHRSYGTSHGFDDAAEVKRYAKKEGAYMVSVYLYEHSEAVYSTSPFSCGWDSGQVGYLLFEKEAISHFLSTQAKTYRSKKVRHEIEKLAIGIIDEYSLWANGECYSYNIENEELGIEDSCGGFIGRDWLITHLKDVMSWMVKEARELKHTRAMAECQSNI